MAAWLERATSPRLLALYADHVAGMALRGRSYSLWLEARDHPLRGSAGFAALVAGSRTAVEVRSHPVLGETVALSIGVGFSEGAR